MRARMRIHSHWACSIWHLREQLACVLRTSALFLHFFGCPNVPEVDGALWEKCRAALFSAMRAVLHGAVSLGSRYPDPRCVWTVRSVIDCRVVNPDPRGGGGRGSRVLRKTSFSEICTCAKLGGGANFRRSEWPCLWPLWAMCVCVSAPTMQY